jgi:protein BCP1
MVTTSRAVTVYGYNYQLSHGSPWSNLATTQDNDMVNVDFEWFDPQPAVDFHGLKTLLRQLLDVDNELFNLSALADLILEQPMLGSTVKVDGNESDPYAFLTILNLRQHKVGFFFLYSKDQCLGHSNSYTHTQDKPVVQELTNYLSRKASSISSLSTLPQLLAPDSNAEVGLILTERFINMPSEIVTPMYTMLQEEIQWALDEKEPYNFTHYLILSKTYTEVDSKLDAQENRPQKKGKKQGGDQAAMTFYFHPEDEALQRFSAGFGNFDHDKVADEGASDAKRAFQEAGIRPQGHLILVEASRFNDAVKAVGEYLSGS